MLFHNKDFLGWSFLSNYAINNIHVKRIQIKKIGFAKSIPKNKLPPKNHFLSGLSYKKKEFLKKETKLFILNSIIHFIVVLICTRNRSTDLTPIKLEIELFLEKWVCKI